MTKQDEVDLKMSINNLLIQSSVTLVKQGVMQSTIFGMLKGSLPDEQFKFAYTHYVNMLENAVNDVMDSIEPLLFDTGDPAFLLRQRMDTLSAIASMKMNEDYTDDSGR